MAFPGPGAQVYYNEAGEVLGWDYPSYDPPEYSEEDDRRADAMAALSEDKYDEAEEYAREQGVSKERHLEMFAEWRISPDQFDLPLEQAWDNWTEWIERKAT